MSDEHKESGFEAGHGNQAEERERAELVREITAALDGLSPEALQRILAALILLFER